jgi:hypothetical protein
MGASGDEVAVLLDDHGRAAGHWRWKAVKILTGAGLETAIAGRQAAGSRPDCALLRNAALEAAMGDLGCLGETGRDRTHFDFHMPHL